MPKVQAYVYDITQGMASMLSQSLVGKQVDIIPHTGIVVFGKEYFFGSGPCIGTPGQSIPVPTSQILDLGETTKTCEELETYINTVLALEHTAENYNLLNHNCNHFADDVSKFLLDGTGLPSWIVNIANEALSTPQGQSLRAMIENMEASMRANTGGGGSGLNPYANVGSGGAMPAMPAMPQMPAAPAAAAMPAAPAATAAAPPASDNEELEAALREVNMAEVEVRRVALQTLLKITENVEKNPAEEKFRKIKMSNPIFTNKVAVCSGGVDAMVACGWLPDCTPDGEDAWVLDEEAARRQATPKRRFAAELAKIPAPAPAAPPRAAPVAAPAAPAMPDFMGGGGMPSPAMMAQAQQMMQQNPQMMAQAQQMMQNPQMMAQMQQMMQNPQMMSQLQQMMGGMGGNGFGGI